MALHLLDFATQGGAYPIKSNPVNSDQLLLGDSAAGLATKITTVAQLLAGVGGTDTNVANAILTWTTDVSHNVNNRSVTFGDANVWTIEANSFRVCTHGGAVRFEVHPNTGTVTLGGYVGGARDGTPVPGGAIGVDSSGGLVTYQLNGTHVKNTPPSGMAPSATNVQLAVTNLQSQINSLQTVGASNFTAAERDPGSGDGANGDFWLNTISGDVFGPKAANAWPATPDGNAYAQVARSNFTPLPSGLGHPGSSSQVSRYDHVHPAQQASSVPTQGIAGIAGGASSNVQAVLAELAARPNTNTPLATHDQNLAGARFVNLGSSDLEITRTTGNLTLPPQWRMRDESNVLRTLTITPSGALRVV